MCNPALIFAGIGLGGNLLQGVGAAQEHEANAQNYEINAKGLEHDIATERESSAYEIARTREDIARTQGSARAGFAGNGLALSGSAAEVLRESAIEGDLDVAAIRWNSQAKVDSLNYQREGLLYNAGQERGSKGLAFLTPVISGVAKFGTAFG